MGEFTKDDYFNALLRETNVDKKGGHRGARRRRICYELGHWHKPMTGFLLRS